ncbi:putative choline kinase 2 [Carex littledalei]|uniref:Putative choline kinase 2 n=1 Tax=Carex littledalei TaxID=544730 RepID=A0A833QR59_9POAL|nr:putative choline kinase 2 [Carex littledalei]
MLLRAPDVSPITISFKPNCDSSLGHTFSYHPAQRVKQKTTREDIKSMLWAHTKATKDESNPNVENGSSCDVSDEQCLLMFPPSDLHTTVLGPFIQRFCPKKHPKKTCAARASACGPIARFLLFRGRHVVALPLRVSSPALGAFWSSLLVASSPAILNSVYTLHCDGPSPPLLASVPPVAVLDFLHYSSSLSLPGSGAAISSESPLVLNSSARQPCLLFYTCSSHGFDLLTFGLSAHLNMNIPEHVNDIDFDYKEYARQQFQQYWVMKPVLQRS